MKNFSTVSARIAVAALFTGLLALPARAATICEFRPNAPDQHMVVKGDTLWDISGKFLEHPWCWPQVWGMNKEEIKNPHWIYPGQIVYFDRVNRRLSLNRPGSGDGLNGKGDLRVSPQIRTEGLGADAIASIPATVIEPFLSQPLLIEPNEMAAVPRIVAARESRIFLAKDEKVYVRGILKGNSSYQVFRPGIPLKDPQTGKLLAYEAVYLGTVKLSAEAKAPNDVHSFTVSDSKQEMAIGDLLMPAPPTVVRNYVPHQPDRKVDARVVGIYSGVTYAGQNQIVSINRGSVDGLDVGSVLQLYNLGKTVKDRTAHKGTFGMNGNMIKLPDEQSATLFIFRTFKNISYGLIMQSVEPVEVGDVAKSPE
ncbi:MAG: LysM peptidoglycan-binding domain-containing protein [Pseudomonadota bacterium]